VSKITFNPENKGKDAITIKEILEPAMKIKNKKEAVQYLTDYVEWYKREYQATDGAAIIITKKNIGYYAGYYGWKKRQDVFKLFDAVHPFFGNKDPSNNEALELGRKLAKEYKETGETTYQDQST
jgi:hypothetical protein